VDREVVWTEPAWEDLKAAAQYIARDSEYYAAVREGPARGARPSFLGFSPLLVHPLADHAGRRALVPALEVVPFQGRRSHSLSDTSLG
jgi:hypothetical protein